MKISEGSQQSAAVCVSLLLFLVVGGFANATTYSSPAGSLHIYKTHYLVNLSDLALLATGWLKSGNPYNN